MSPVAVQKKKKTFRLFIDDKKKKFFVFGQGHRAKIFRNPDGEHGWSLRTADFKLADGTELKGFVSLCDMDSGEHYGSGFYLPESNDIVEQDDEKFIEKMGKTKEQIYPYSYRYHGWEEGFDHHINEETGWSN